MESQKFINTPKVAQVKRAEWKIQTIQKFYKVH